MATMTRADGRVIAWGGEVDGPNEIRDEKGLLRTETTYTTKLGVGDAELREIVVRVPYGSRMVLGPSGPQLEDLVKKCVVRYIENQCINSWIPRNNEHFTINDYEMLNLREQVLRAA